MSNAKPLPWPPEHRGNLQRKPVYRFAALTWGSRGDVQPFVTLGTELVRRGHQVVLAARERFRSLIEEHGIELYAMEEDGTEDLMESLANSKAGPTMLKILTSYSRSLVRAQFLSFWEASQGADVILTKAVSTAPALHIAERRGLPLFLIHFDPGFIPTKYYCLAGDRIQDRGKLFNQIMGRFMLLPMGISISDLVNIWRKEQQMPIDWLARRHWPSRLFRFPTFIVWSPHLLKRPSDWPEWFVQTGWWRLSREAVISHRLHDFLTAGSPPIYIGFGSWGVHDKTMVTNVLLEALRVTGNRAILLRNTVDGRTTFPENIFVASDLPHDWLLPRLKAAVHHGGAGTTGEVTAAGIPSVVIPAFPAQAVWGHMAIEKGIGTLLERDDLRVERLVAALHEVERPEVQERARDLGSLIQNDGAEKQAADEIERWLRSIANPRPAS